MLDLYLIRHAECDKNLEPHLISGRSSDSPPSPSGGEQASLLGQRLVSQGVSFQRVFSSPAIRCRETAVGVGQYLGYSLQNIVFSDQLLELDQGQWEGQPRAEIYTPRMLATINAQNWEFTPPGGESQRTVEERMVAFVQQEIMPLHQEDARVTCAIFGHGVAFKCFLCYVLNSSPNMTHKIVLNNTAITRLRYDHRGWHLLSVNDIGHLLTYQGEIN